VAESPFFPYPTVSSFFDQAVDFPENMVDETVDEPVCESCGEPNPARTKDEEGNLKCESCLDDEAFDPCCYNSTRNFGTGEHEYGCPNA
jgi:hypothetical protein